MNADALRAERDITLDSLFTFRIILGQTVPLEPHPEARRLPSRQRLRVLDIQVEQVRAERDGRQAEAVEVELWRRRYAIVCREVFFVDLGDGGAEAGLGEGVRIERVARRLTHWGACIA